MAFKKFRDLKVYQKYMQQEIVPEIRLQGKWLQELEFAPGTPITVTCDGGRLVITKRDEIWDESKG